jgi:hypothetical protein
MGYAGGTVVLEAMLALVGYAWLRPFLVTRTVATKLSYLGLAVMAGNAAVAATVTIAAVAGARTDLVTVAAVAATTAGLGLLLPWAWSGSRRTPPPVRAPMPRVVEIAAIAAGTVACAIAALILYGGFRSTPWLDDSWFFWVPKGIALDRLGLDPRLFIPSARYQTLVSPDYPLGWSVLLNTGMRLAGKVDIRVVNCELAIVTVAFLGAALRLMWGLVRPVFAVGAVALLALSPDFERQSLGGGADLPVAYFVTLFALAAVSWLADGERLDVVLAGLFAAGGLATKNEAGPELVAVFVVLVVFGARAGRARLVALAAACAAAAVTAVPWFAWRQAHGVQDEISFMRGIDPGYLAGRTSRVGPTVSALLHHLFDVRAWLVIIPLVMLLSLVVLALERRPLVLAPIAVVVVMTAILVWVYWADPLELQYKVGTSVSRSIDAITVLAALACAGLADRAASALGSTQRVKGAPPTAWRSGATEPRDGAPRADATVSPKEKSLPRSGP